MGTIEEEFATEQKWCNACLFVGTDHKSCLFCDYTKSHWMKRDYDFLPFMHYMNIEVLFVWENKK